MPCRDKYKQPEGLIGVLLKTDAEFGDRDDAAMDLGEFDEPEAEEALLTVAEDPATDPMLAESCAESLGEIWARRDTLNVSNLRRLAGEHLATVLEHEGRIITEKQFSQQKPVSLFLAYTIFVALLIALG